MSVLSCLLLSIASFGSTNFDRDLDAFRNSSFQLRSQKAELAALSDRRLNKELFWTPQLNFSMGRQKTFSPEDSVSDYAQLQASLNLFRGGGDLDAKKSASAAEEAFSYKVQDTEIQIEASAAGLIFKNLSLAEVLVIQKEILRLKEEALALVKSRYRQGRIPLHEVARAEVDLNFQREQLREAELNLESNRAQIRTLLKEPLATVAWPWTESQKTRTSDEMPAELLQRRWELSARESSFAEARSAFWPQIDLSATYRMDVTSEQNQKSLYGGITLTLPLWSQYETQAQKSSAFASYLAAQMEFQATEQRLGVDQNLALIRLNSSRASLQDAKANLGRSKDLYADVLNAFKLGRVSTNDLITEQSRLYQAETAVSLSKLRFHQALVEFCTSQGLNLRKCLLKE